GLLARRLPRVPLGNAVQPPGPQPAGAVEQPHAMRGRGPRAGLRARGPRQAATPGPAAVQPVFPGRVLRTLPQVAADLPDLGRTEDPAPERLALLRYAGPGVLPPRCRALQRRA